MAVRTLDAAVLMRDAGIVAGRRHAVVGAQGFVAAGQVLLCVPAQVTEGSRQAVGAMLPRRGVQRPEGVLQAFGQGDEALAAENDVRMLEARAGEPEMIEPVIQRRAGDGDAQVGHVGEVGQAEAPRFMSLPEDDLLLRAVQGPP